jgi:hypothetical protein
MIKICSCYLSCLLLWGCGSPSLPGNQGNQQLSLPKALREISGLAQLPNGQLLAVADEKARVYNIDFKNQTVSKFSGFGKPAKKGDFEGIAFADQTIYLVTSDGEIWQQALNAKAYAQYETGLGKFCEVEGLAAIDEPLSLLILCKQARKKKFKDQLLVYRWNITTQTLDPSPFIRRSFTSLGLPTLSPSGLSLSANRQHLFFVAAREQFFFETTLDGQYVRGAKFPYPQTHPQTEGVFITRENTLYLADEGGKDRGTVTQYVPSF